MLHECKVNKFFFLFSFFAVRARLYFVVILEYTNESRCTVSDCRTIRDAIERTRSRLDDNGKLIAERDRDRGKSLTTRLTLDGRIERVLEN